MREIDADGLRFRGIIARFWSHNVKTTICLVVFELGILWGELARGRGACHPATRPVSNSIIDFSCTLLPRNIDGCIILHIPHSNYTSRRHKLNSLAGNNAKRYKSIRKTLKWLPRDLDWVKIGIIARSGGFLIYMQVSFFILKKTSQIYKMGTDVFFLHKSLHVVSNIWII